MVKDFTCSNDKKILSIDVDESHVEARKKVKETQKKYSLLLMAIMFCIAVIGIVLRVRIKLPFFLDSLDGFFIIVSIVLGFYFLFFKYVLYEDAEMDRIEILNTFYDNDTTLYNLHYMDLLQNNPKYLNISYEDSKKKLRFYNFVCDKVDYFDKKNTFKIKIAWDETQKNYVTILYLPEEYKHGV